VLTVGGGVALSATWAPVPVMLAPRRCQTVGLMPPLLDRRARLAAARLYLVCPASFAPHLGAALAGGVEVVQLRDKALDDEALLLAAREFRSACDEFGALFVLNDRPDLVLAARADGVHVGQDDASVSHARAAVGSERLVGLSTHSRAQVDAAAGADVDYFAVGPVHATPTKPGRPAVGLDPVRHAADRARVPFFAIGGLQAGNVAEVLRAGAERVVVVRAIVEAADPAAAARALRGALPSPELAMGAGVGPA